jgi:hypothetical protein
MIMTRSMNVAHLILSRTVRQFTVKYLLSLCDVSVDFSVLCATKYELSTERYFSVGEARQDKS